MTSEDLATIGHQTLAYVDEAPVRIWHWMNAASILMLIVTGMAHYAEGAGLGSFSNHALGWVRHLAGDSEPLQAPHRLGMWFIVIFMIIHIYVAIRENIISRQSIESTMISGHRTFKDDRPD